MGIEHLFEALLLLTEFVIAGLWAMNRTNAQQIQRLQQELTQHKIESITRAELTNTVQRIEQKLEQLFRDVHTKPN